MPHDLATLIRGRDFGHPGGYAPERRAQRDLFGDLVDDGNQSATNGDGEQPEAGDESSADRKRCQDAD